MSDDLPTPHNINSPGECWCDAFYNWGTWVHQNEPTQPRHATGRHRRTEPNDGEH